MPALTSVSNDNKLYLALVTVSLEAKPANISPKAS